MIQLRTKQATIGRKCFAYRLERNKKRQRKKREREKTCWLSEQFVHTEVKRQLIQPPVDHFSFFLDSLICQHHLSYVEHNKKNGKLNDSTTNRLVWAFNFKSVSI